MTKKIVSVSGWVVCSIEHTHHSIDFLKLSPCTKSTQSSTPPPSPLSPMEVASAIHTKFTTIPSIPPTAWTSLRCSPNRIPIFTGNMPFSFPLALFLFFIFMSDRYGVFDFCCGNWVQVVTLAGRHAFGLCLRRVQKRKTVYLLLQVPNSALYLLVLFIFIDKNSDGCTLIIEIQPKFGACKIVTRILAYGDHVNCVRGVLFEWYDLGVVCFVPWNGDGKVMENGCPPFTFGWWSEGWNHS